ncbi:MAG: 1-acyl-sn-glycerol-3-phosphate acyltransferase [Anaerolineae bacterium]|nr:1-acyl-sn-glycerol-3-phosphate acyltransferase [Anaerolineae bacterium]
MSRKNRPAAGDPYPEFRYPRRRVIRQLLRWGIDLGFAVLTDLKVIGRENLPDGGPLLVVGNHFSFVDPAAMIRAVPWPIEFVGGFRTPNAPPILSWIPNVWGRYAVFRGTGSRYALRGAEAVLKQKGIVGIFPEAGSWAAVLRPARPGTAFLAAQTGVPLLPIGLDGMTDVFPSLGKGKRARVTVRIGSPFGPFRTTGRGRERRLQLEEIGHRIMERIAELIPPEQRGHYSDDPAIREAAKGTEIYPWAYLTEEEVEGGPAV